MGGRIDVRINNDFNRAHLIIEDSGPGIPRGERERVFDRFYRCLGHETPGSGLGLAIVKQAVEQNDAHIQLGGGQRLSGLEATVSFKRPEVS